MNKWNYHTNKETHSTTEYSILFSNTNINGNQPYIKISKRDNEFISFGVYDIHKILYGEIMVKFDDNEYNTFGVIKGELFLGDSYEFIRQIKQSKKIYIKTNVALGKVYKKINNIQECVYEFDCEGLDFSYNNIFTTLNKKLSIWHSLGAGMVLCLLSIILFGIYDGYKHNVDYRYESMSPYYFRIIFISIIFTPFIIAFVINLLTPKYKYITITI
jgi:hypothetical protein